jgi:hypothetical protein
MMMTLERWRLTSRWPWIAKTAGCAQRLLWLNRPLPRPFADARRRRLAVLPLDLAMGEPLTLGPRDILVTVGCDWHNRKPAEIEREKRAKGFCYVVLCYDIIPLQFPSSSPNIPSPVSGATGMRHSRRRTRCWSTPSASTRMFAPTAPKRVSRSRQFRSPRSASIRPAPGLPPVCRKDWKASASSRSSARSNRARAMACWSGFRLAELGERGGAFLSGGRGWQPALASSGLAAVRTGRPTPKGLMRPRIPC